MFEDEYDILVNGSGFFNNWKWPNAADRSKFKGRLLHTAAWPDDADADLDGKTVALIGNGSSGVQVLPAIIERVKKGNASISLSELVSYARLHRLAALLPSLSSFPSWSRVHC